MTHGGKRRKAKSGGAPGPKKKKTKGVTSRCRRAYASEDAVRLVVTNGLYPLEALRATNFPCKQSALSKRLSSLCADVAKARHEAEKKNNARAKKSDRESKIPASVVVGTATSSSSCMSDLTANSVTRIFPSVTRIFPGSWWEQQVNAKVEEIRAAEAKEVSPVEAAAAALVAGGGGRTELDAEPVPVPAETVGADVDVSRRSTPKQQKNKELLRRTKEVQRRTKEVQRTTKELQRRAKEPVPAETAGADVDVSRRSTPPKQRSKEPQRRTKEQKEAVQAKYDEALAEATQRWHATVVARDEGLPAKYRESLAVIVDDCNDKFGLNVPGLSREGKATRESAKKLTETTVRRYVAKGDIGGPAKKKGYAANKISGATYNQQVDAEVEGIRAAEAKEGSLVEAAGAAILAGGGRTTELDDAEPVPAETTGAGVDVDVSRCTRPKQKSKELQRRTKELQRRTKKVQRRGKEQKKEAVQAKYDWALAEATQRWQATIVARDEGVPAKDRESLALIVDDCNDKFGLNVPGLSREVKATRESRKMLTETTVRRYVAKGDIGSPAKKKGYAPNKISCIFKYYSK